MIMNTAQTTKLPGQLPQGSNFGDPILIEALKRSK